MHGCQIGSVYPTVLPGAQGVLAQHSWKFSGVLNGIDHETWDPCSDPLIPARFSADDLSGKRVRCCDARHVYTLHFACTFLAGQCAQLE
jgi:glycogen synthase